MSTSRVDNEAYQDKVKIVQAIYKELTDYAKHLTRGHANLVIDQNRSIGRDKKLKAINDILYLLAETVDYKHKKKYKQIDELFKDDNLKKAIEDLPNQIPKGPKTVDLAQSFSQVAAFDPLDELLKTKLPTLLKLPKNYKEGEVEKTVERHLKKRRDTHDVDMDNAIRSFFDKMSHGLFAKVSGRKVVKEIKSQLKLFDQQVKEREKAEKAEEKRVEREEKKADAKQKAQEKKKAAVEKAAKAKTEKKYKWK